MRKVIKISVKLLSALVLLLIILPLAVSLLLDIPAVQNFIVHKAADWASGKLETRVSIDRVNIGLLNKLHVNGFYVEDYQRDTLLYVDDLRAYVTGFGIFGGGLSFGFGDADGVKLFLKETPDSVMNIKQVVDRISKKKGKGNFRLHIIKVDVADVELRIERLAHRNPEYGVDYGNMRLYDMNGRVNDLVIAGSSISGDIGHLSLREISGFTADDITGAFKVDRGLIELHDAEIITERSDIELEKLILDGGDWSAYKDFIHNVRIEAEAKNSSVSSVDVGYFAPKLRDWQLQLNGVKMNMSGTVSDFTGTITDARTDGGAELRGDISATGLPDLASADLHIDLHRFDADAAEIGRLAHNIARVELPEAAAEILQRISPVILTGEFTGRPASFDTHGRLDTPAGAADFNAAIHPAAKGRNSISATVSTRSLNLGRIVGNRTLGTAEFAVAANGTAGRDGYDISADGDIRTLALGSYVYDSIRVDGRIVDGLIKGTAEIRDRNLDFDLDAVVRPAGKKPKYDMVIDLRKADLAAMGINKRDSVSVVSANIGVSAVGRIPDEVNGELSVADARYRYNDSEITSEHMTIAMQSNEDLRSLKLTSDFADAVFESRNDYKEVWAYMKDMAGKYLPLLRNGESITRQQRDQAAREHNLSLLSLTTKNFNPVADALSSGLQVADGSRIQILLDPVRDRFVMRANSDYIERNRLLATSMTLNVSNRNEALDMSLKAGDLYIGTFRLPDLTLHGDAADNRIDLSGQFRDTVQNFAGSVGINATLRKNKATNSRGIDIGFTPSWFERKDERWEISADGIAADSSHIAVNDFAIRNSRQELIIDGVASRSRTDSLTLKLNNFDLAPLAQFASRIGYSIEGRTNGYATVKSALRGSEIAANIRMDSIEVNTIPVKSLEFDSKWDFELNRARFSVATVAERDTVIRGFFAPSQVRYYAKADIDSLDMALLNPLLQGVVSQTRGVAKVDLSLTGERRKADLHGNISVRDLSTKVDFTQVTYTVPKAEIAVRNNRFTVDSVAVYDMENHSGKLSFDLSLNHLSNISYKLGVQPQRMLVLNTTAQDNDYFYGKVYASGAATITGDKRGVNMDIVAATNNNTEFFLPLSSKSNVSNADFVIFEQADKPDTTNFLVRKKMMFERKQRQRTSSAGRLDINMSLDVRPNAMFQLVIDPTVGDIIKGRGEGALNLHINPKANVFEMYGDYTITEGSYLFTLQNIINKKFIIDGGSTIHWTGEPVDALLNIDAVYKLKASLQPLLTGSVLSNVPTRAVPVECIIHLNDRLTNPTVTFDVVVPNVDPDVQAVVTNALSTPESRSQQFLYLLVANSFISEASTDTSSNIGATASAATGFELLSNQLSNWLSSDAYNIVIRYRPKTDVASDEVDIGFSTELVNNRLLLEVEGNYLVDKSMAVNSQASNIMGEAYLTWLIDRAGNLRLRGFTHTIDRFDENQGLQETGIGIYYKESFNNLKDLKQRVIDRFTNRRRRAEREARAAKRKNADGGNGETGNDEDGEAGNGKDDEEEDSEEAARPAATANNANTK